MYEVVAFDVITTAHVPSVVLQLFSKGLLKISKVIPLNSGRANFTMIPKFSYTPKAHCIVWFIDYNGEVISDSITLHFDNVLPNYVNFYATLLKLI